MNNSVKGHLSACITISVWGTTFISTKVLLRAFTPIEILFMRFLIGYCALWLVRPKPLALSGKTQEKYFMAAGLCGVTLYYLFENIALMYTLASNVSVVMSIAPFFTAIFFCLFLSGKRPSGFFFLGFAVAMAGICLISFQAQTIQANPLGDALALFAALVWAGYSTLTKKISGFGYGTIEATRRIFFYGLIFMLPVLFFMDFRIGAERFLDMTNVGNILFLGFGASALCFVTWNTAVKLLGSVKTSVYIYAVPVITTATSAVILHEPITQTTVLGIVLTLIGLYLSEKKTKKQEKLCDESVK